MRLADHKRAIPGRSALSPSVHLPKQTLNRLLLSEVPFTSLDLRHKGISKEISMLGSPVMQYLKQKLRRWEERMRDSIFS